MKKSEVPQQKGALGTIKEMCYATDENGNYTTTLSSGWDVKSTALEASLQYIDEQLSEAKKLVSEGITHYTSILNRCSIGDMEHPQLSRILQ